MRLGLKAIELRWWTRVAPRIVRSLVSPGAALGSQPRAPAKSGTQQGETKLGALVARALKRSNSGRTAVAAPRGDAW